MKEKKNENRKKMEMKDMKAEGEKSTTIILTLTKIMENPLSIFDQPLQKKIRERPGHFYVS